MSSARDLAQPPTLIEEILRGEAYERGNDLAVQELIHLEPSELAKHIDDTCHGDPRCDYAGHLTDGLDDMAMVDRPKCNQLVRKLLLGEITIEDQARLNEICVKAMLAHGLHEVRAALEQARKAVRR